MHVLYTHASHPPMSARTHTLLHLMHLCTHTPMHLCTEYGLCSRCHRCASTYVLACIFAQSMVDARVAIDARPCLLLAHPPTCVRVPMRVRVCQCVCLGLCPGVRVTRAHAQPTRSQISVMVMWRLAAGKDHVACPMLTCVRLCHTLRVTCPEPRSQKH